LKKSINIDRNRCHTFFFIINSFKKNNLEIKNPALVQDF